MKQKIYCVWLTFFMCFSFVILIGPSGSVKGFSGTGSGTSGDPYQITNADELNETRDDLDGYYILMNDIDLDDYDVSSWNGGQGFIPIGTSENENTFFSGYFNGQNHIISNLYVSNFDYANGLFGMTLNATIINLFLNDVYVNHDSYSFVGGLIGAAYNTNVSNCHVTGTIFSGNDDTGGLIGSLGGFAYGGAVITQCYIVNCSSSCSVAGAEDIGGFIGQVENSNIFYCYSMGTVTSSYDFVGGFIGSSYYEYTPDVVISDCYSRVDITGYDSIGGFIGLNTGNVYNCYSTGFVDGYEIIGGFCGYNDRGTIEFCYWDAETSGTWSSDGGRGHNTGEMVYPYEGYDPPCTDLYEDWDFTNIWLHDNIGDINDFYPYLGSDASGYISMNVFNESNCEECIPFDVLISNRDGTLVFEENDNLCYVSIPISELPYGEDVVILVSSSDYNFRVFYVDLVYGTNLNMNVYLPPRYELGGEMDIVMRSSTNTVDVPVPPDDMSITTDYTIDEIINVQVYNNF
jgi:hypothetical protein